MIEKTDGAEMRDVDGHNNGMIFLKTNLSEEMIQGIQTDPNEAAQKLKQTAK